MKKNNFTLFLAQEFDIDHKKVAKQHRNIQKLAWEQVLLLTISVRQRCFPSYYLNVESDKAAKLGHDFTARMRLIDIALWLYEAHIKEANDELLLHYDEFIEFILKRLDDGCGIIDLTIELRQKAEKAKQDKEKEGEIYSSLLYRIEEQTISFSKINRAWGIPSTDQLSFQYSCYAMYMALYRPIELFTPLLRISQIEEVEDFQVKFFEALASYVDSKYSFWDQDSSHIRDAFRKVNDLPTLQAFMEDMPDVLDSVQVKECFINGLMRELADCVADSFNSTKFQGKSGEKPSYSSRVAASMIEKLCKFKPEAGVLKLSIQQDVLERLLQLGQVDAVMSEIRAVILNKPESSVNSSGRGLYQNRLNENSEVFVQLSSWYEKCQTAMFRKFEDIPRLIAAIIVFDVRHRNGQIGMSLRKIDKKLSSNDIALYSAKIISYCLYRDLPAEEFIEQVFNPNTISFADHVDNSLEAKIKRADIELEVQISQGLGFLKNSFMETWATNSDNDGITKTINNIKKLPPFERTNTRFIEAESYIKEQKALGKAQEVYYPLGTSFPLPLWSLSVESSKGE